MLKNVAPQTDTLPEGFTDRPATMDDLDIVLEMVNHCSTTLMGVPEMEGSELKGFWENPKLDMNSSTRLVFNPAGKLVAYADVDDTGSMPVRPMVWGRVHPDFEGLGIGSYMLTWSEQTLQRALDRVPDDIRVAVQGYALSKHETAVQLLHDHGYKTVRHFWQMEIELDKAPQQPVWPDGITLTTYADFTDLPAIVAATDDGFKDHWGHVETPLDEQLEQWRRRIANNKHHDPTLWFLALEGDEITAVSLCSPFDVEDRDCGWVNQLAVRRPWRRRGLGLAILQHTIAEFHRRGQKRVGLGVDAGSLTGATRLYEKAGMHVKRQYDTLEKELRAGRNISTESLE